MSIDRKEILHNLLTEELNGMNFRRQAEWLTGQLVHERFMATEQKEVAHAAARLEFAEENRVLDTHLTEYQNLEGALCPTGMDFKSYFEQLEEQIVELQKVRSDLLKLSDSQNDKIEQLRRENEELKRKCAACEESKKESAPPPPTQEPTKEDEVKDEEPTEEHETCTESEPATEGEATVKEDEVELFSEEEWEEIVGDEFKDSEEKPADEVPPMSEALKAVILLASELPAEVKDAGPLNFQALLDEALKG